MCRVISNPKQASCKKSVHPQKGHSEKRCEIQGDGRLMAKFLITTIQVNLCCLIHVSPPNSPELSLLKILPSALGCHIGFHIFFHNGLFWAAHFFYSWAVLD